MSIKCYAYGALAPKDPEHLRVVHADLARGYRYQADLTELEGIYRAAQQAITARGEYSWWAVAWKYGLEEALHADKLAERNRRGCSWGTGGLIEKSVEQAAEDSWPDAPARPHWDGTGRIAVQLQHGLSVADLLAGRDPRARLSGEGKHRQLWLRLGYKRHIPSVEVMVPVTYHRDLPPGGTVKYIRVHVTKRAGRLVWSAQFVLDLPAEPQRGAPQGTVALDIGWRLFGKEVRYVSWADDSGRSGEFRLPASVLERLEKSESLQSIRDTNFNAALANLMAHRHELPEAQQQETVTAHVWKSQGRLAGLVQRWKRETWAASPAQRDLIATLEAWRYKDQHLWQWEAHGRANALDARKDIYRRFARWLADTYATVVVEKIDLRDFAERPKKGEPHESHATQGARPQRHKTALSEMRDAAEHAVVANGGTWRWAPAAWTTQTCNVCLEREPFDAATEVKHTCSHCGATWDQDINAARNLLRAATSRDASADRSQEENPKKRRRSTAAERRAKGLATRRAQALAKRGTTAEGVG